MSNPTETPMDTLVNALYGGTTPTPESAPPRGTALTPGGWPPASATPTVPVDTGVFGTDWQPPPLPADRTLEEVLFPSSVGMAQVLRPHMDTLSDVFGYGQAERETFSRNVAEAVQEARLEPYTIGAPFAAAIVEALSAQRRGAEPDTARLLEQEEDVRREYRVMLGEQRSEKLFNEVSSFYWTASKAARTNADPGVRGGTLGAEVYAGSFEHVRKLRMSR